MKDGGSNDDTLRLWGSARDPSSKSSSRPALNPCATSNILRRPAWMSHRPRSTDGDNSQPRRASMTVIARATLVESIPKGLEDLRDTPGVQYTEDVLVRLIGQARSKIDLTAMYWNLLPD